MTKPTLEYILSGTSYIGLNSNKYVPESRAVFEQVMAVVEKNTEHKFGVLFNALVEKKNGENIKKYLDGVVNSIHADSGGLQMVTLGLKSGDEEKLNVYKTQAEYCDIAMSFDEIPVIASKSSTTDYGGRTYDESLLEMSAVKTGQNLLKQIEYFNSVGTSAKPLMIVQGNCYDTYMRWTDAVMSQIPQDMRDCIGGVAIGAAALGSGDLEEVEKSIIMANLPGNFNHYHILGVGSISRLLPTLVLMRGGVFDGKHISYDSTTHSSNTARGTYQRYYNDYIKLVSYPTGEEMPVHHAVLDDMCSIIGDLGGIASRELYLECMLNGGGYFTEMDRAKDFNIGRTALCIASIINFCRNVEDIIDPKNDFSRFTNNRSYLESFSTVRTKSDYDYWFRHVGRFLKSNRVESKDDSNLDFFFG